MESSVNALAKYRFESSQEALADAKLMLENGRETNTESKRVSAGD